MNHLQKHWREIKSAEGEVLYWRRDHSGYEVWPHVARFSPCIDMYPIGPLCPTLDHAMLACREHLHRSQQYGPALAGKWIP